MTAARAEAAPPFAGDDTQRRRSIGERGERPNADHRQRARRGETLRDAAGDPQTGERAGSGAVRDAIEIAKAQTRGGEQRVDLAEDELGMALAGVERTLADNAGDADGERQPLGGGLDREQFHAADSIRHGRATLRRR